MPATTASAARAPYLRLMIPIETRLELQRQALEGRRSIEAQAEYLLEQWMSRAARRRKAKLADPGLVPLAESVA